MPNVSGNKWARERLSPPVGEVDRTKQSDASAADINTIVRRWLKTGVPPQSSGVLRYGDFSSGDDYLTAMLKVGEAEAEFAALPAQVRKACDNDPGKFLDMVSDPERREELEQLGLVERQVPAKELEKEAEKPPEKAAQVTT